MYGLPEKVNYKKKYKVRLKGQGVKVFSDSLFMKIKAWKKK